MSQDEHIRRAILELIASDPDGDWDIASLCEHIYGRSDPRKYYVIRRVIRDMMLPGTWRLGWRKKSSRTQMLCGHQTGLGIADAEAGSEGQKSMCGGEAVRRLPASSMPIPSRAHCLGMRGCEKENEN